MQRVQDEDMRKAEEQLRKDGELMEKLKEQLEQPSCRDPSHQDMEEAIKELKKQVYGSKATPEKMIQEHAAKIAVQQQAKKNLSQQIDMSLLPSFKQQACLILTQFRIFLIHHPSMSGMAF